MSQRILRSYYVGHDTLSQNRESHEISLEQLPEHITGNNIYDMMDDIERKIILNVLNQNQGNRSKTAEILGISRRQLIRKIEKLNIHEE